MTTKFKEVDQILVKRLNEYIDPWWLFQRKPTDVDKVNPVDTFTEERNEFYDLGRTRFFRDQLLLGKKLDPIVIDCRCAFTFVYPDPVIIDGWHRFAAHLIANKDVIEASFSGRVDLLKYLIGETDIKPED